MMHGQKNIKLRGVFFFTYVVVISDLQVEL